MMLGVAVAMLVIAPYRNSTPEDIERVGADGVMRYCLCPGAPRGPANLRIRLMTPEAARAEAAKYKQGFGKS